MGLVMMDQVAAMATWVGALSRGGILYADSEEEGAELALEILGEDALGDLREWFASQTKDVVERERRGAIHACVWMANADRDLAPEEIEMLEQIIAGSELPPKVQEELVAAIEDPLEPTDIAEELTQPGLRELVLGLAIRLAHADHTIDPAEEQAYEELTEAFSIDEGRAVAIRRRLVEG